MEKTHTKSTKMPPRHPPKTNQNRPKSLPRRNFFTLKFRPRLRIDFGPVLAPIKPPCGHPFGDQNRSKNRSKIGLLNMSRQDRPKTAPKPPKTAPRPPKTTPRPPKSSSRDPPDPSKCPQLRPRDPKNGHNAAPLHVIWTKNKAK